ncbi:hypothetical protein [Thioclava kandeliae]|uniref:VPLPA-CTERM sorting domain-containing protein n=1 Tax=Thioclava kandeliae TaxID=3070818 RepID=A0ABV1SM70_9RHOB
MTHYLDTQHIVRVRNQMRLKSVLLGAVFGGLFPCVQANAATYTYVGSWEVGSGYHWLSQWTAYSGTEAAAYLFGGNPEDYVTSTVSNNADEINFMAWYSVLGVKGGQILPQDLQQKLVNGYYFDESLVDLQSITGNMSNPASAYVNDAANGSTYTNYAFLVSDNTISPIPLPSSFLLLLSSLAGIVTLFSRKRMVCPT